MTKQCLSQENEVENQINVNHSIGRLKRKKNHKHQIDIGKAFNKGQNPFLIESFLFIKLNRRELCQYDKGHLQKKHTTDIFNDERLVLPPKVKTRQYYLLSPIHIA